MPTGVTEAIANAPGRLFWQDGFLKRSTCETMREELDFAFWQRSTVYQPAGDGKHHHIVSDRRISYTTSERWFTVPLRRRMVVINRRIDALLPGFLKLREEWQATKYAKGGRFNYHQDAGQFGDEPAGERTHTVLLYLDTPARGGETHFPLLDIEVEPRCGRLLVWRNLDQEGSADPDMLHASRPLAQGVKTIFVTWVRQRPAFTNSKGGKSNE
jgi:prolyl 4-hydroxylase